MLINRRTFQRYLLLGAAARLLPPESPLVAQTAIQTATAASPDLAQPFAAQVARLIRAMDLIGTPFSPAEAAALKQILAAPLDSETVSRLEAILKPHVLLEITINPESRVSVTRGAASPELVEHGWLTFLLRITNQAKETSPLEVHSHQALPMGRSSGNETDSVHDFTIGAVDAVEAQGRWLELSTWDKPPLEPTLSGLDLEYRILELYSRDHGRREASLEVLTGPAEQDLGYRSTVAILFDCRPSHAISLDIRNPDSTPSTASLVVTDSLGRIYPARAKRALPDLWFQPQIYRHHGESLLLPAGSFSISYGRGPEFLTKTVTLDLTQQTTSPTLSLPLERWIVPAHFGYFSGDTHIHAAGCSHYESPSEGVTPEVMLRQVEGEALDLGAVLTWAPGFLYQSQFFSGHVHHPGMSHDSMPMPAAPATTDPILRYDLEVSGFPSSHCGHLVLLNLREQRFPGTTMPDDWPSWNLPILKWAKSQGALTGYAHSGHGMVVDSTRIPNHLIPAFDSCGANEYLVDVTHPGMLDFISGCDLWPFVELNLWYHVLNCGFPLTFAGETDFPCITDHCVGGGRSYVAMDASPAGDSGYTTWLRNGFVHGRSYFGDGRSHIFHLAVSPPSAAPVPFSGEPLHLEAAGPLHVTAEVCARLEPTPTPATEAIRRASPYDQPFWHLERARLNNSRSVPVELIVNGRAVQTTTIPADGQPHPVTFDLHLDRSSWIALRILPSSHTNPVPVLITGKPIRASTESARWCRRGVDVCWEQKSRRIRPSELAAAAAAYQHARETYDRILAESPAEG